MSDPAGRYQLSWAQGDDPATTYPLCPDCGHNFGQHCSPDLCPPCSWEDRTCTVDQGAVFDAIQEYRTAQIEVLIERSSLGTAEAKAIRDATDPALAQRVVAASHLMETGGIWEEVAYERGRAHLKHGDTSMESLPVDDLTRLTVLMEEVGEVAREFNEARHRQARGNPGVDLFAIRTELIQVAAMAGAWADAIKIPTFDFPPDDPCPAHDADDYRMGLP